MHGDSCPCGLIVSEPAELNDTGLCLACAGTGHEWGCACLECALYFAEVDRCGDPDEALAAILLVAA